MLRINDRYETADGRIARVTHSIASNHALVAEDERGVSWITDTEGKVAMIEPGPHPAHLKRFIGR